MLQQPTPELKKPVGIWIRVSTENQAQGDSPEHHEKRARYYAEAKGWHVREIYHLEAVSGKSVMEHPETKRMLKDLKRGHISALIFSKLARLARNTRELLDFADIFRSLDADLVSLQESIDTSTPAGRLFYTMIAAMAQWEREEIGERVSASVIVRAKLGKPTNGKAPFGFYWKDRKLVPHPERAPICRLIYELYAEHGRKKVVARLLNERGYRTRDGSKFSDTSIELAIRDPAHKGRHRANYTSCKRVSGQFRVLKPESEWIWTEVEPIVSEELWERCNMMLDHCGSIYHKRGRRPVTLFAGFAVCGCGTKMYVRTNTPKYVCGKCWNRIPIVDLEAVYYEQLKGFFLSPERVGESLTKADETIRAKEELRQSLEGEEEKVRNEVDRIYRLYIEQQISPDAFGRFYRPLEERQRQLGEELPRVQAEVDLLRVNHIAADQVLSEATDLYDRWPTLTEDEKRKIIESITDKIVISKDDIDITLCYVPSSEELTKRQRSL